MRAEPAGSASQAASRATATKMQAHCTPSGILKLSTGELKSSCTCSDTAAGRRVVVTTFLPCARITRAVADPISEFAPTINNMTLHFLYFQSGHQTYIIFADAL